MFIYIYCAQIHTLHLILNSTKHEMFIKSINHYFFYFEKNKKDTVLILKRDLSLLCLFLPRDRARPISY